MHVIENVTWMCDLVREYRSIIAFYLGLCDCQDATAGIVKKLTIKPSFRSECPFICLNVIGPGFIATSPAIMRKTASCISFSACRILIHFQNSIFFLGSSVMKILFSCLKL